jgi:fructokinase
MKHIVCFGEILWDVMPGDKQPGGAPVNVAAHARSLGIGATPISRVGTDALGDELLAFLKTKNLPLTYVQRDALHTTSRVIANTENPQHVRYEFDTPTAWDFIEMSDELAGLVTSADLMVFGSLASRMETTRNTLLELLAIAPRTVFDINLRPPFYEKGFIEWCLKMADLVKVNDEELDILAGWFDLKGSQQDVLKAFQDRFGIASVCVTRGGKGAWLLEEGTLYEQTGVPISVVNTIGAGDAFLAAYLAQWLQGKAPQERLAFACAVGAYVSTFPGATPALDLQAIGQLIS